jgi:PDZ domain
MTPLAAFILLSVVPLTQDTDGQDQPSVDQLVTDLGSRDPKVADRAEAELKKRGRDAVPALREAARSDNAERAMRARTVLLNLAKEQPRDSGRSPAPRMSVLYEDWTQGIKFALKPDGSVEFTAPEKDGTSEQRKYQTYRASSMDEFKKQHPELVEKYGLDKIVSVRSVPAADKELREWLGLTDPSEDKEQAQGRRFGILITPVGPALAAQLGLSPGDGLLVRQVEPGSLAETSGVKRYDVITALDGTKAQAPKLEEFRKGLQDAIATEKFTLELLRNGKRETLTVKPAPEHQERKEKVK